MKKALIVTALICIGVLTGTSNAAAIPILCPYTGHYYEAIAGKYDWDVAKSLAEGLSYNGVKGHLAAINSQSENDWIWTNIWQSQASQVSTWRPTSYWLGGFQDPQGSEPAGGWQWVTGEPWSYTNWNSGEPNDSNGNIEEDAINFAWASGAGAWNDISMDSDNSRYGGTTHYKGYIVEYPVPEPMSMSLLGMGLLGAFGAVGLKRRRP